jgi:hypothetical protein
MRTVGVHVPISYFRLRFLLSFQMRLDPFVRLSAHRVLTNQRLFGKHIYKLQSAPLEKTLIYIYI